MTRLIIQELPSSPAPEVPPDCPPMPPATVLSLHGREVEVNTYRLMERSPYWQHRLRQHYAHYEPPSLDSLRDQALRLGSDDSPPPPAPGQYDQATDAAETYWQDPVRLDDDRLATHMRADHVALFVALLEGHDLLPPVHMAVEEAVVEHADDGTDEIDELSLFSLGSSSPASTVHDPFLGTTPPGRHRLTIGHRPHPIAVTLHALHYVFHLAQVAGRPDVSLRVMAVERAAAARQHSNDDAETGSDEWLSLSSPALAPPILGPVDMDGRRMVNGAVRLPRIRDLMRGLPEEPRGRRPIIRSPPQSRPRQSGQRRGSLSAASSGAQPPVLTNGWPVRQRSPSRDSSTTPTPASVQREQQQQQQRQQSGAADESDMASEQLRREQRNRSSWLLNHMFQDDDVDEDEEEQIREAERSEWARDRSR